MTNKALKLFVVFVLLWFVTFWVAFREFTSETFIALGRDRWGRYRNYGRKIMPGLKDFSLKPLTYEEKIRSLMVYNDPPGDNGTEVEIGNKLSEHVEALVDAGWNNYNFNEFVSDIIPLNRSLPDLRLKQCRSIKYPNNLPVASVIISFYNEAWSTLLRTVHSVINRTPHHLLKEIILIDDNSNMVHLKERLKTYVEKLPFVKLIRNRQRKGLIKSRQLGAELAMGQVIVFLDSHCECTEGWLAPLLDRIYKNPKTVVTPVIDRIVDDTFQYVRTAIDALKITSFIGFTWDFKLIEQEVPVNRSSRISPIKTPAVSGIFAINKRFFLELGSFDKEFDTWGGENFEISFKVWMCGGTMEINPCSHVGHVYRRPIQYEGLKSHFKKNLVRLAEVWMDDYAQYYYARIADKKGDYGNVTERKQLRTSLNCQSFDWYIKNIYPQLEIPRNMVATGQVVFVGINRYCLDVPQVITNPIDDLKVLRCHNEGGNQYWLYSNEGELRKDNICIDYLFNLVTLIFCKRTKSQIWLYDPKTHVIRHMETQKCLYVKKSKHYKLMLGHCAKANAKKWEMENFKASPKWQKMIPIKDTLVEFYDDFVDSDSVEESEEPNFFYKDNLNP